MLHPPALLSLAVRQRQDRVPSRHAGRDAGSAWTQPCRATHSRVYRATGRARQAGLRKPRRATLAGSARRPVTVHSTRCFGDDLFSRQPICEAALAAGRHFLFVCKPASHPTIEEYRMGVRLDELKQRIKRGRDWFTYRYQWMSAVPLRDDIDALNVNRLMIEIVSVAGKVTYRNSFVISSFGNAGVLIATRWSRLPAASGRARWKIENESFNTLKNQGYNLEHNIGHGSQNLSAVLTTLNLPAFACHTVCDLAIPLWRAGADKIGTRKRFFKHLRSITVFLVFPSGRDILETLAFVKAALTAKSDGCPRFSLTLKPRLVKFGPAGHVPQGLLLVKPAGGVTKTVADQ